MITIGADPEVFLGRDGKFVSAHDVIPGTKYDPHKVNYGAIQVDGVAAEINILPASSFQEFRFNIQQVLLQLEEMIGDLTITQQSTVLVDLDSLPDMAKRLSCESDINPYEDSINPTLDEQSHYRSAGGHIHIGGIFSDGMTGKEKWDKALRLARLLDKFVGVPSLSWDKDKIRRATYGKAGNCRVKDYGLEYRALSNVWLFNPTIMRFVYDGCIQACIALEAGEDGDTFYRDIINGAV